MANHLIFHIRIKNRTYYLSCYILDFVWPYWPVAFLSGGHHCHVANLPIVSLLDEAESGWNRHMEGNQIGCWTCRWFQGENSMTYIKGLVFRQSPRNTLTFGETADICRPRGIYLVCLSITARYDNKSNSSGICLARRFSEVSRCLENYLTTLPSVTLEFKMAIVNQVSNQ